MYENLENRINYRENKQPDFIILLCAKLQIYLLQNYHICVILTSRRWRFLLSAKGIYLISFISEAQSIGRYSKVMNEWQVNIGWEETWCGTGCYLKISISNWNILLIYGKISIDNLFSDYRKLSERRVYVKKNRN